MRLQPPRVIIAGASVRSRLFATLTLCLFTTDVRTAWLPTLECQKRIQKTFFACTWTASHVLVLLSGAQTRLRRFLAKSAEQMTEER